jgi:hypothetical protein
VLVVELLLEVQANKLATHSHRFFKKKEEKKQLS